MTRIFVPAIFAPAIFGSARISDRSGLTTAFVLQFILVALLLFPAPGAAADSSSNPLPQIQLDARNAGPRTMETLTEQNISRQYASAWQNLAAAFAYNQPAPLGDYFIAAARKQLTQAVTDQQKAGLHSNYLNQRHKVNVVFYAPEGDVVEIHDTVQCDFEVFDGEKLIHKEPAVLRYVVLMTPSADRWLIRQLQAVSQF
jgi:hypothetical protein